VCVFVTTAILTRGCGLSVRSCEISDGPSVFLKGREIVYRLSELLKTGQDGYRNISKNV
jgi:hypothetical protein